MFKLKIYCNDGDVQYWDDGIGEYENYDKALIACYENSLYEANELMGGSNMQNWFEVNMDFEITESYKNDIIKDIDCFPVATIFYDKAPWEREGDCCIEIITGYYIVEV